MHKNAQLPPQCIKCCAPAEGGMLKRKLHWHSPWLYLMLLVVFWGWILLAIIASCISERATIHIGLCARHRRRRVIHLTISWMILLGAIVATAGAMDIHDHDWEASLGWTAVFLAVAAPVYGTLACRMVVPTKIDRDYVWLKGVSKEFAGQFPALVQQ